MLSECHFLLLRLGPNKLKKYTLEALMRIFNYKNIGKVEKENSGENMMLT